MFMVNNNTYPQYCQTIPEHKCGEYYSQIPSVETGLQR